MVAGGGLLPVYLVFIPVDEMCSLCRNYKASFDGRSIPVRCGEIQLGDMVSHQSIDYGV